VLGGDGDENVGGGLGVVTVLELKELILHWTQFLTHTPFVKSL